MVKLVTEIPVQKVKRGIEPGARIITLGSCFATKLSASLAQGGFAVNHNPFGTLYTPTAITTPLLLALHPEYHFSEKDLLLQDNTYHALSFANQFQDTNAEALLERIEKCADELATDLIQATHVVITFGTAWQYFLAQDHTGVGNCHKLPGKLFTRELLTVEEMVAPCEKLLQELQEKLPEVQIILSVSPVRHMRDNPLDNGISKASLILAAHTLAKKFDGVHYFPAYEIMMDELRDYRFYNDDLTHPSPLAQEIIFERFSEAFLSTRSQKFVESYKAIKKAREHVVQKPSRAHQFGQQLLKKVQDLEKEFPEISLKDDKDYFSSLIG